MTRSKVHQDRQVTQSDAYDDALSAGVALQTGAQDLQADLNALRSQLRRIANTPHWYDDPAANGLLRRLLFYVDEGPVEGYAGAYKEISGSPWPSAVTWYTDATKVKKIVGRVITRNSDQAPTQIAWVLYDIDGVTPLVTVTDVITNTGSPPVFEASRVRTVV